MKIRLLNNVRSKLQDRPKLKNILANTSWLFFDKVLRMGVGMLVGVWLARYLGPQQFGLFNYVLAFTALFSAVATLGMDTIVVKNLVQNPEQSDLTLGSAFFLRVVAGIISLLLASVTIYFIRPGEKLLLLMVLLTSASFIFQAFDVIDYYYQSYVKARYTVIARNTSFLILTVFKVIFILNSFSLIAFVWIYLLEFVLSAVFLIVAFQLSQQSIFDWKFDRAIAKQLLKDSWVLILSSVMILIYMRIDQLMLGDMLGNKEVGIYSAAVKLTEVWYFVPTAIVASVFPAILAFKQQDETIYYARLQQLYRLMTWLAIAIALPMTFLSNTAIEILYGKDFAEAGPILSISIWAGVFVFQGIARGYWLITEGLQHYSLMYVGGACILNIALNLLLIPMYHSKGAAIATLIAYGSSVILFPLFIDKTRNSSLQILKSFLWVMK